MLLLKYHKCHLYAFKKIGYVAALGKDILLVISFPSKQKKHKFSVHLESVSTRHHNIT